MKSMMLVLAASTALSGCATMAPSAPVAAEPIAAPTSALEVAPAPRPEIGTYGFDTAGMDPSVKPGDDFYQYANGTWAKNTPIPADKSNYGMFTVLDDLSKERTKELIEAEASTSTSRIGQVYSSFMDVKAIEAKGLAPIAPWLNEIKAVGRKSELPRLYARSARNGVGTPFGAYVGQDDKAPDQYVLNMFQSGLGMPDRDYYLSKDAKLTDTRAKYADHLTKMLMLAGEPNAAARARAIVAFETQIAAVSWTRIDSRNATKTYNKMTVAALDKMAPGFGFADWVRQTGAQGVNEVIVAQPSALKGIASLIAKTPLDVLKDQLLVRSLDSYSAFLPSRIDQQHFAFYGTTLSGTPEQEVRWKRGVDFTVGVLQDDVSKLYVAKYFPPETKAAADALVKNVISAMGRRIDQLDWMAPETKARAHVKLAAFTPKIGYPDRWRDMSALVVDANDLVGNAMRSRAFDYAYNLNKLGKPIYKWEWGMTPMTVNAYANFGMVEIVFPASILQPPFFDPNADPAVNYGGIGAVIGHELSHHFDDQGAKYDSEGRLTDWWAPNDVAAFTSRLGKLGAQYDAYEALPGKHVQGQLTMGENTADLAGLSVAHDAYVGSLGGAAAPVIDGTTGDQRFYLGWAQVWRRNYREANLLQRLLTDSHSPSEFRTDIVRNLDPWYGAFKVQPSDKLYLAPEARVRIW